MNKKFLKHWSLAASFVFVLACSSYDLGKEKQVEISVNAENPTFDGDIAPLIQAKCSSCHTSERSKFVPGDTTVGDAQLDAMHVLANFRAKATRIRVRVSESPSKPMPPHFATQLTANEKAALLKYVEKVEAENPDNQFACPNTTSALTYADVSATLTSACASCHTGSYEPTLSSLEDVKTHRADVTQQVGTKQMPQGDAAFHDTPERASLVEWLCGGSDLN